MADAQVSPASRDRVACRLDEWLAAHGPLAADAALVLALGACAAVSRLGEAELSAVIDSLRTSAFTRGPGTGWTWQATPTRTPPRTVADADVVERLGAVLAECLTGAPLPDRFADEERTLARLRAARPDLPQPIAALTARAVCARAGAGVSLPSFGDELRVALGMGRARQRTASQRRRWAGLFVVACLVAAGALWLGPWGDEGTLMPHALGRLQASTLDAALEEVDYLATTDEHTAAIQELARVKSLVFPAQAGDDPRAVWLVARDAWVRHLSGDLLTAEQNLTVLARLDAMLGRAHPYTRALRLAQATVVEARNARDQAATLRAEADEIGGTLVPVPELVPRRGDTPWPPHVLAHVAPNAPEREGFRQVAADAFVAPMTSTQRWYAGRDGWALHVGASGTCRTSVSVGADARSVGVSAVRRDAGEWEVQVDGVSPVVRFASAATNRLLVTVTAAPDGSVAVQREGGPPIAARLDLAAAPARPPYGLVFDGPSSAGVCAVVWFQIASPAAATRTSVGD